MRACAIAEGGHVTCASCSLQWQQKKPVRNLEGAKGQGRLAQQTRIFVRHHFEESVYEGELEGHLSCGMILVQLFRQAAEWLKENSNMT